MHTEELHFTPDKDFAAEWFIDDPLAQGAMKNASVTILDSLKEAQREIRQETPDLGEFGPLGMFPSAVRPALTPKLVDGMRIAATVMGWKLAQPGDAIAPGCLAEELALEMIRQEAICDLELVDAPKASYAATTGVFEVCQDDDVLDLFDMVDPSDTAVALSDPLNVQMGKVDMRPEAWFQPFYGGRGHPAYNEH